MCGAENSGDQLDGQITLILKAHICKMHELYLYKKQTKVRPNRTSNKDKQKKELKAQKVPCLIV